MCMCVYIYIYIYIYRGGGRRCEASLPGTSGGSMASRPAR